MGYRTCVPPLPETFQVHENLIYRYCTSKTTALTCLYSAVYLESSIFYYNGVATVEKVLDSRGQHDLDQE